MVATIDRVVSSWLIDLTSRSGSTARASTPRASSDRWAPLALPTAASRASWGTRAISLTVLMPRRRSLLAVAGPIPQMDSIGRGWRNASSSPGRMTTTPAPARLAPQVGLRFGRLGGQLGQEFGRRHPDRAGEAHLARHPVANGVGDLRGRAEQADGPGDVEERLVQGDALHQRGVLQEYPVELAADL